MKQILVVEDDYELNCGLTYSLEKENYKVLSAYHLKEAKEVFSSKEIDFILLDVNLPDGEGFEFCSWVKQRKEIYMRMDI